jgi:hypothetical protein
MPFAVTAVLAFVLLALTIPSEALQSCRSRIEARQHSGSVHLHLHSPDHCRDTIPAVKVSQLQKVQPMMFRPGHHGHQGSPNMAAGDETMPAQWTDRWLEIEASQYPALARWIEMVQLAAPVTEPWPEPPLTPRSAVLAAIAVVLTLGTIEVLFRCTIS